MKIIRIVIAVILIFVMSLAWFSQAKSSLSESVNIHEFETQGDKYLEKKLFQKAVESYSEVVVSRPDKSVYEKLLEAAKSGYKDSIYTLKETENIMFGACKDFPKEPQFWEDIISFSYEEKDFKNSYNYLKKAKKSGIRSETLSELEQDISYSFVFTSRVYTSYSRSPEGYYTVTDGNSWGIINTNGDSFFSQSYTYASPMGIDRTVVLSTEKDTRVYDEDGVVLAYLPKEIKSTKAIEGCVVPVALSSGWKYYQYEKDEFISDLYKDLSSFSNGVAAVKSDETWALINADIEKISDQSFDDIKSFDNGTVSYDGIMIASENSKYGIYDADGKKINDFICKDADVYYGGAIAYEDETGKWGFVDKNGNVIIEPKYDKAKSFSNNLAAVKSNGKWGFIDTEGRLVIDYQFLNADYFTKDGMVMVSETEGQYFTLKLRFPDVLDY